LRISQGDSIVLAQDFSGDFVVLAQDFSGDFVVLAQDFSGDFVVLAQDFSGGLYSPSSGFLRDFVVLAQDFSGDFVVLAQDFSGDFVVLAQDFSGDFVLRISQGDAIVLAQDFSGDFVVLAQDFSGDFVVLAQDFSGDFVVLAQDFSGDFVVLAQDFSGDFVVLAQDFSGDFVGPLLFDDVAIFFTHEEWGRLEGWQKELYKEVMMDNYRMLQSLGVPLVKSELLVLIESGEEPCVPGVRWEEVGWEPPSALDLRDIVWFRRDWSDRRPLTYRRRVVRKRCGRRSPNFSRVELECFVSLMDRYLPDELQRVGAISLRQRRAILQEIARCLEPMSGCLRTPRQLLHRWADFNNRDPERLMEIRMQLHLGGSHDQKWNLSEMQSGSYQERRWKRRISCPLDSSSSSSSSSASSSCSSEEGEEACGDLLSVEWDEALHESSTLYFPVVTDPPRQAPLPTHIDAEGRYIVPPPTPNPGGRQWQDCAGEWMEKQSDLHGSPAASQRSPGRAMSTLLSLHEGGDPVIDLKPETHARCADLGSDVQGLRTIKLEPDSEEDEGGGSWSLDIPSPESVVSNRSHRRKLSEGASAEQPSPENPNPYREPPTGGRTDVKMEFDLSSGPYLPESPTYTEREVHPGARSIKRSPNFSPAELECFVALMDHFLPDNRIRAGAIPIRQRKAILLEIARRLEPLSGCLRTPRQLRHRWTDFNNRDPDRLEEIRHRLRRAGRQESCMKPSKVAESTSTAGRNWRRSHLPQQTIKEEVQPPEQVRQDPPEENTPKTPWHHIGLPKLKNSFSMARLKKNRHMALHILRMERLLRRVDQRQELLRKADLNMDDGAELETSQMQ
ncbi:uncharacterized protein RB166_021238, partial [Leptodactylus fuscus]|uniref:uncharacterized protein LOC142187372 n=1 Tax=Leptodactylus fuscus TaxID=238119 RepID=UPI003F4F223C